MSWMSKIGWQDHKIRKCIKANSRTDTSWHYDCIGCEFSSKCARIRNSMRD